MLCVPVANWGIDSYSEYLYEERIPIWVAEIVSVHCNKPIFLVLTKKDLLSDKDMDCENPVTKQMLEDYRRSFKIFPFAGVLTTSARELDFNVQRAFT